MCPKVARWLQPARCLVLTIVLGAFLPASVRAASIYVAPGATGVGTIGDPAGLQAALDAANVGAGDQVLLLQQGAYDAAAAGGFKITAAGNSAAKSITLAGGWNADYTTQSIDAATTMLDGHATTRILSVVSDGGTVALEFHVENLTFQHGYAYTLNGAGISADVTGGGLLKLYVRHSRFINNNARRLPTSPYTGGHGGAIYSTVEAEVVDGFFQSNSSDYHGGAISFTYRTPSYSNSVPVRVEDSTFLDNYNVGCCPGGSAIMNLNHLTVTGSYFHGQSGSGSPITSSYTGSFLDLSNSVFEGNNILYWGSAVQFWDSDGVITNVAFLNNHAGLGVDGYGAVTYYNATGAPESVTITNGTFVGNRSLASGNGVGGALHSRGANLTLTNLIVWDNGPLDLVSQYGNASISSSDIQGGLAGTGFSDGGQNVDADPMFVGGGDYRLSSPDSPCVDSGDNLAPSLPATDLDGNPRILNGKGGATLRVDMGAYELPTFMCEPDAATIGTRMTLLGKGYGAKKPSVFVAYEAKPGKIKKVAAKVEKADAYDSELVALWTKKLAPGAYDLWVLPKVKGAAAILLGPLAIMAPAIDVVPDHGAIGATIATQGRFFSSKKPKVYLRDAASGKKKGCKVVVWTMDDASGASTLSFVVPKVVPKTYELILVTGIGATTPAAFTVEGP